MKHWKTSLILLMLMCSCGCVNEQESDIPKINIPEDWVESVDASSSLTTGLADSEINVFGDKYHIDLKETMYYDIQQISDEEIQIDVYEYRPKTVEQICSIIFSKVKMSDSFKAIGDIWYTKYVFTKEVLVCPSA